MAILEKYNSKIYRFTKPHIGVSVTTESEYHEKNIKLLHNKNNNNSNNNNNNNNKNYQNHHNNNYSNNKNNNNK